MATQNMKSNGSPSLIDLKGKDLLRRTNIKQRSDLDRLGVITREINPQKLSRIFKDAANPGNLGSLFELYSKIESYDSKLKGLIEKRRKAPTRYDTEVKVKNPDEEGASEVAEKLESVIDSMDLRKLKRKSINGILFGVYFMKNNWYRDGDWVVFGDPEEISPSRYMQKNDNIITSDPDAGKLYIRNSHYNTDKIFPHKEGAASIFSAIYEEKDAFYDITGILRPICKWYLFKYFTFQYWIEYNETYGFPTSMVTVPRADYQVFQDELLDLMQNVGRNKFGIIFDGMDYKIHAQQSNGQVEFFDKLVNRVNEEIVFGILGTNLQENSPQSSYASSVVGYDMETDLIIDDSEFVDETINKNLVQPFISANSTSVSIDNIYLHTNTPERKDWKKIERKWEIAAKLQLKGVSRRQIEDELEIKFAEEGEESVDLYWDKTKGGEHPNPEKRNEEREDGGSVSEED